jgi:hypothetical protein
MSPALPFLQRSRCKELGQKKPGTRPGGKRSKAPGVREEATGDAGAPS